MRSTNRKKHKATQGKKSKSVLAAALLKVYLSAYCVTVLGLWLSALSTHYSPCDHAWLPPLGLMFPLFLAGAVGLILPGLLLSRRMWLWQLLALLPVSGDILSYCPVSPPSPAPKAAFKVLSYNTLAFSYARHDEEGHNPVVDYMLSSGADIILFQEGDSDEPSWRDFLVQVKGRYPYCERVLIQDGSDALGIFSRYPVTSRERIDIGGDSGGAMAYRIALPESDTLTVVNCHLESNRLSHNDKQRYNTLIRQPQIDSLSLGLHLLRKLGHAGLLRAAQADSLFSWLKKRPSGEPLLVAGDFNDTPISYTRRHLMSLPLRDAFRSAGNGPGFTFRGRGIHVRIDHLLHSPSLRPYSCRVDRSTKASDHYPIRASFLLRKKKKD